MRKWLEQQLLLEGGPSNKAAISRIGKDVQMKIPSCNLQMYSIQSAALTGGAEAGWPGSSWAEDKGILSPQSRDL